MYSFPAKKLEPETSCKCEPYTTCSWSKSWLQRLNELGGPNASPVGQQIFQKLKSELEVQICDQKKRKIWCCRNGEPATDSELKMLSKN